jgi:hypothetical protein
MSAWLTLYVIMSHDEARERPRNINGTIWRCVAVNAPHACACLYSPSSSIGLLPVASTGTRVRCPYSIINLLQRSRATRHGTRYSRIAMIIIDIIYFR